MPATAPSQCSSTEEFVYRTPPSLSGRWFRVPWKISLPLFCALFGGIATGNDSAAVWKISKSDAPLQLQGFVQDEDLSGIARVDDFFLLVSDENQSAQSGLLDHASGAIRFLENIALKKQPRELPGLKRKNMRTAPGELDLEAVCYAPEERAFYATGSHGMSKKKGEYDNLRFGVFRIPFDPDKKTILAENITESSLLPWMQNSETFKDYAMGPLQQNGFNVEGLAWADDRLFFGVRGPSIEGKSFIVEVSADELFKERRGEIATRTHSIPLGHQRGIRELTRINGGFLLISGNASAAPSKTFPLSSARDPDTRFMLHFLEFSVNGGPGALHEVGRLTNGEGLAEGLVVMRETPTELDLLVVYDGLPQGSSIRYHVSRPNKATASK